MRVGMSQHVQRLCRCWGSILRLIFLLNKYFTDLAISPWAEFLLVIGTMAMMLYPWMCDLCDLHYSSWKEHLGLSKETYLVVGTRTQAFLRPGILQKRRRMKGESKNVNTEVSRNKPSGTVSASEDNDLLIFISYSLKQPQWYRMKLGLLRGKSLKKKKTI